MIKNYFKTATKALLFTLLIAATCACSDEIVDKAVDPQLNIPAYAFDKEGGSIEITSEKGLDIFMHYDTESGQKEPERTTWEIKGEWYSVKQTRVLNGGKFIITVDENTTGQPRIVPVRFSYRAWMSPRDCYTQE